MRWREWEMWCLHNKLDLIYQATFPASHLEVWENFLSILPPCSHYFVASEGDTATSSCKPSLLSHSAEVLPLPFVVMLSIIVVITYSPYSCAVPSQLHWDYMATANFDTFPRYSILLSWLSCQLLLGCLVIVAKVIKQIKNCYISWRLLHFFCCHTFVNQS